MTVVRDGEKRVVRLLDRNGVIRTNGENAFVLVSIEPAGVNDPCLIVAELEELGVCIRTAAAALAQAVINIRNHSLSSPDQCCYPVVPAGRTLKAAIMKF